MVIALASRKRTGKAKEETQRCPLGSGHAQGYGPVRIWGPKKRGKREKNYNVKVKNAIKTNKKN
jgi:hypothetical protein